MDDLVKVLIATAVIGLFVSAVKDFKVFAVYACVASCFIIATVIFIIGWNYGANKAISSATVAGCKINASDVTTSKLMTYVTYSVIYIVVITAFSLILGLFRKENVKNGN